MTEELNDYSAKAADWRGALRSNNRRTLVVISMFFLIYMSVGLLIDTFAYIQLHSAGMSAAAQQYSPQTDPAQVLIGILTLQIFPLATIVMLGIAAVSLWVTFTFSNQLMLLGTEYREITPETAQSLQEKQLYNVVEELKIASGLNYMPKVYIINADYMNAFASGYSEKTAMVAITTGLMSKLDRDELQAVMAHEMSHVRHMDIKLTLIASLLANLTLMVLDFFLYSFVYGRRSNDNESRNGNALMAILLVLRYLLPVINILLLLYLSRTREYMADAGCVELTRANEPLARALLKISDDHKENIEQYTKAYQETPHEAVRREAYIFDPTQAGIHGMMASLNDLYSTHPSVEKRLAALGYVRKK